MESTVYMSEEEVQHELHEEENKKPKARRKKEISVSIKKYVPTSKKVEPKRLPAKQPNTKAVLDYLKKYTECEELKEAFIKLENIVKEKIFYIDQIDAALYHLQEPATKTNVKVTPTMLEIYFGDEKRQLEGILRRKKKNESKNYKPNKYVGRPRLIKDEKVMTELQHNIEINPMDFKDVSTYLYIKGYNFTRKQLYGIGRMMNDVIVEKAEVIEEDRYKVSIESLEEYLNDMENFFKINKIPSSFVYNIDEVGFDLFVDQQKTLKFKSETCKRKSYTPAPRNTSRITMLGCISLDCNQIDKLLLITPRTTIAMQTTALLSSRAIIKTQENGFLTKDLFIEWFKEFVIYNNMKKKRRGYSGYTVIVMDNFQGHIDDEIKKIASANKIVFKMLPAHSSHLSQPLDLEIFSVLKKELNANNKVQCVLEEIQFGEDVNETEREQHLSSARTRVLYTIGLKSKISDEERMELIIDCWDKATHFKNVKSSFRQAGFIEQCAFMMDEQIKKYIINNKKGDIAKSEMTQNIVSFNRDYAGRILSYMDKQYKTPLTLVGKQDEDIKVHLETEKQRENRLEISRKVRDLKTTLGIERKKVQTRKQEKKPKK